MAYSLHWETHKKRKKMSMAINRAVTTPDRVCGPNAGFTCDEMLIQAYLQSTHNLHIRRTLDQFYYHAISTEDRDTDQVVYRYTRDKGKERKVFMVDQLWLWILDKDLIVTAFPQRWEQPKVSTRSLRGAIPGFPLVVPVLKILDSLTTALLTFRVGPGK